MTFEVSGVVVRYESVLFLLMYAVYIALMYFNRSIEAWIVPKFPSLSHEAVSYTHLTLPTNREV